MRSKSNVCASARPRPWDPCLFCSKMLARVPKLCLSRRGRSRRPYATLVLNENRRADQCCAAGRGYEPTASIGGGPTALPCHSRRQNYVLDHKRAPAARNTPFATAGASRKSRCGCASKTDVLAPRCPRLGVPKVSRFPSRPQRCSRRPRYSKRRRCWCAARKTKEHGWRGYAVFGLNPQTFSLKGRSYRMSAGM